MFGTVLEIKELFHRFNGDDELTIMAASYVLWAIPNLSIVLLLLYTCEKTRDMAYDTSSWVHKIIQQQSNFMSDTFYCKMKAFSLKVLHRKRTFNFTGQGLFNLDYTFIFSVSASSDANVNRFY